MNKNGLPFMMLSVVCSLLSGCASTFQSGGPDAVSEFPTVGTPKTIFVDLAFSGKLNGEPWKQNDAHNREFLEDALIHSLEESRMFSLVSDGLKTTDLQLHVAVINEKKSSTGNLVFSTCTLFLYPNTETDTFRLMASLKESSTGRTEKIQLSTEVKHRQHLLLGLLAPFKSRGAGLEQCTDRLMDNLVLEIHKTGMVK